MAKKVKSKKKSTSDRVAKERIHIYLREDDITRVEQKAKELGLDRSPCIQLLINTALNSPDEAFKNKQIPSLILIGSALRELINLFYLLDEVGTVRDKKNRAVERKRFEQALTLREQEKDINKHISKIIKGLKKIKI